MPDALPKLHHSPSSYYSTIARLALVERGIAFEPVKVDIHRRAEQTTPAYARLNPGMTVPTLETDGRVLRVTFYSPTPGESEERAHRLFGPVTP